MNEPIPHFSTISYNFKHRYMEQTIEEIFYWILKEISKAGYLSPEAVFIDGTHVKANANIKKAVKKAVPQAAKIYEERLMEEINEDREDHGKKPFDKTKTKEEKAINESTTDPESGVFHKGEHKKCFAYTAQTGGDKNGYVMDVTVNPGNVHDSVAFDGLYDRLTDRNPEIKAVVADAGYKTPWISKRILDDSRIPVLPYKRPMGKKDFFPPYEYAYDEYFDCVICPENQVLSYATTNREGYREFKSKTYVSYKDLKALMADLKRVYAAVDEETAMYELEQFAKKWDTKYPKISQSWQAHWPELSTYFKYPQSVRTLIYTTNSIESFNRQLRKVSKNRSVFPNDDSLLKILYLAQVDITRKWTDRRRDWGEIHSQLEIFFADRLPE